MARAVISRVVNHGLARRYPRYGMCHWVAMGDTMGLLYGLPQTGPIGHSAEAPMGRPWSVVDRPTACSSVYATAQVVVRPMSLHELYRVSHVGRTSW